jgi:hypothetical protein
VGRKFGRHREVILEVKLAVQIGFGDLMVRSIHPHQLSPHKDAEIRD